MPNKQQIIDAIIVKYWATVVPRMINVDHTITLDFLSKALSDAYNAGKAFKGEGERKAYQRGYDEGRNNGLVDVSVNDFNYGYKQGRLQTIKEIEDKVSSILDLEDTRYKIYSEGDAQKTADNCKSVVSQILKEMGDENK